MIRKMLIGGLLCCMGTGSFAQSNPRIVGVPPSDAYIGLSRLSTGEIRYYNYGEHREKGRFYLSSTDDGENWKRVDYPTNRHYADVKNPLTNTYIRLFYDKGVYCVRYKDENEGAKETFKVSSLPLIMIKPPIFIKGGKRVIVPMHYAGGDASEAGARVLYSDDDGLTWSSSEKVRVPAHKKEGFHEGVRWNHGAVEPTVVELNDGRLWMIMRTAQDSHYQSYSYDGGETWTTPTPSPFYGTITMPTLTSLKDGRILFVWNNTTALPEMPTATGYGDDVFTNRNVVHAAISEDDGRTWIGCRELFLDARRNARDFGMTPGSDKSVHQSQLVQPNNDEAVIALGQHPMHRKILHFDIDWLYESERESAFENGLDDWTTFLYFKGIKGHCGYNRHEGAALVAHPYKAGKQVLHVKHTKNDSLVNDGEGALWNFPAMKKGKFTTSIRITKGSRGGELVLNDRWFNPSDTTAAYFGMYVLDLTREKLGIEDDKFHDITIKWDLHSKETTAKVYVDKRKKPILTLPLRNNPIHGLSYVHFIASKEIDEKGIEIEQVKAKAE